MEGREKEGRGRGVFSFTGRKSAMRLHFTLDFGTKKALEFAPREEWSFNKKPWAHKVANMTYVKGSKGCREDGFPGCSNSSRNPSGTRSAQMEAGIGKLPRDPNPF
jgi:hypothetical protein